MELRQLRYFVAVVEKRGFRKASRELYVAQPPLSRALQQLEFNLGVQLLHRTPHGVELTDSGREFLVHARAIIAQADAAERAMRDRIERRGVVRIGVVAGVLGAGELTAPIFDAFRRACPHLGVELEELSFVDQIGPVLEGALDVALVRDPLDHPDLDIVPLASEERALMVGASHALATETVVSANDVLKEHTLPLGSPDPWSAFWQLDDLRGGPNRYADTAPATTISSMQLAVANADMIITVPGVMSRFAPNTLVHYVGLRDAEPSTIAVARRRNDRRTEVAAFVDQAISTTEAQIDVLPGGTLLQ